MVRNSLLEHLVNNGILSDYQHGFVRGRSCKTQLLKVIDKWTEALDLHVGIPVDVVGLYTWILPKRSMPHERLMMKLAG